MDTAIIVAFVALAGSIIVPPVSSYYLKKREIEVEWQRKRIKHYEELLSAISDLAAEKTDKDEANKRYVLASNTIALVANQSVVSALMGFHHPHGQTNIEYTDSAQWLREHDEKLKKLLIEIRKDIGLTKTDNEQTFEFHLISRRILNNKDQ
jgi:hypothetical protein